MKKVATLFAAIVFFTILFTSCSSKKNDSNSSSSTQSSSTSSQALTCDECGSSFQKSNGVQLSGHSEVFCGSACATRWGFNHGISVN